MTKLQFLNAYFTERLMAAAQEIMKVVGDTVLEYQEETDRTKRENESLKRRLLEVELNAEEASLTNCSQPVAPPLSVDWAVTEQHERSSTLRQDTEPTLTAVKVELTEQHRDRQGDVELRGLEPDTPGSIFPPPCGKMVCNQESLNESVLPTSCVKRDPNQESPNHPDLRVPIVNTDEVRSSSNVMLYQVKTETDAVDCSTSEQPTEPLSFDDVNLQGNIFPNKNRTSICRAGTGGQMSESDEPLSTGTLNPLKGQSTHSCPQCGKTFRHMSQVRRHLRMHTGEKPFCCALCEKCFRYSGNLKEHQRVHTGEKPHGCNVCGKYFSKSAHLKVHLRVHTGEKPYSCTVCGKCFSQSNQLKMHLRIHSK